MTDAERLAALAPALETIAPRLNASHMEMVERFFREPAHPSCVGDYLGSPLGCAWGVAAAGSDDEVLATQLRAVLKVEGFGDDVAWGCAQAGVDIVDSALERHGAEPKFVVGSHAEWWRAGLKTALDMRREKAGPVESADWLAGRLSAATFARVAQGVAAAHLDALCMGQGRVPEDESSMGPRLGWNLPIFQSSYEHGQSEALERAFHWAMIERAMAAKPDIQLPQGMLDSGLARAVSGAHRSLADEFRAQWSQSLGQARAAAQRAALEGQARAAPSKRGIGL
jgi:hypothetical protein